MTNPANPAQLAQIEQIGPQRLSQGGQLTKLDKWVTCPKWAKPKRAKWAKWPIKGQWAKWPNGPTAKKGLNRPIGLKGPKGLTGL